MDKYEIVKTLGQGGYGTANLVRRKTDKKLFVEKEVRLASLSQKDRDGAIQEAKLLASLRHPYIVEYEESFQERGNLYIVMGYADGGDLAKKIENRGNKLFTEDEIMHDFIEIALAIKYIHDRKICHRDLKGQNIFLTKDGTIKLGDFGISKILETTFQACRTQIGTPFYLSPEICQGMEYNTKTDIWSLGCILYELCTLKHAFKATNISMLMVNIIQARYSPIPSHYSQDLRTLVDKMLTKEPEKRPNINQILNTPYIKNQLGNFLDKNLLDYEMGHTRLHNRKPFAPPTVILSKEEDSSKNDDLKQRQLKAKEDDSKNDDLKQRQLKAKDDNSKASNDGFDDLKEKQKQLKAKEAFLDRKEAEIAERERRALQNSYDDEYRAKQRAMSDNKKRLQQEMSGDNMKYVLQSQFPRESQYENRASNQGSYEQQARDNYLEQLRMAKANRERMKREELQGTEMQKALMDPSINDDDYYRKNNRKNKGKSDNYDDLNAYMRQQRHEAAENKRRLLEAQRGSAAKEALAQSDDYLQRPRHQTIKRRNFNEQTGQFDYDYYSDYYYSDYSEDPPKRPQSSKQKQKDDNEALNEYMRQLRHEREANRLRCMEAIKMTKEQDLTAKKQQENTESQPTKKKPQMSQDEVNAYMREERQKRRENKAKIEAMGPINMDQLIAEAEDAQRKKPKNESSKKVVKNSVKLKAESNQLKENKCQSGFLEQTYSCNHPLQTVKFVIQKSEADKVVDVNPDGIASIQMTENELPDHPERLKFRTFISFPEKGNYKVELHVNGQKELNYNVDVLSKSSKEVPIDSVPFNFYKFVPISPKTVLTAVTGGVAYFRFAAAKNLNCYFDIGKIDGKTFNYASRKKYGGSKVSAVKLEIPFDNERYEYHCTATFPSDGRWAVTISMDDENNTISEVTKFFYDVTGADAKKSKASPLEFMYKGRVLAPDNKIKITQSQIDELPDPPQSENQIMNGLKNIVVKETAKKTSNVPDVKNKEEEKIKDTEQSKCCLLI